MGSLLQAYGFYAECMARYKKPDAWKYFTDMFDYLPLCALVDGEIFAVHGGTTSYTVESLMPCVLSSEHLASFTYLASWCICCGSGLSPTLHTLDQIRVLDRFHEVPFKGAICDLMWGDPEPSQRGFRQSTRGAGFTFGGDVVDTFLYLNGVSNIVRSHQLCHEGYQELWNGKFITVWSAPNYCYRMKNMASILEIGPAPSHERFYNVFQECPVNVRYQKGLVPPPVIPDDADPSMFGVRGSTLPGSLPGSLAALGALNALNALNRAAAAAASSGRGMNGTASSGGDSHSAQFGSSSASPSSGQSQRASKAGRVTFGGSSHSGGVDDGGTDEEDLGGYSDQDNSDSEPEMELGDDDDDDDQHQHHQHGDDETALPEGEEEQELDPDSDLANTPPAPLTAQTFMPLDGDAEAAAAAAEETVASPLNVVVSPPS